MSPRQRISPVSPAGRARSCASVTITSTQPNGRPDREWGEVVVAYVVGEAPPAELDALCLSSIARFKRPNDYVFVDALPKNNYGKILKTELREMDSRRVEGLFRPADKH